MRSSSLSSFQGGLLVRAGPSPLPRAPWDRRRSRRGRPGGWLTSRGRGAGEWMGESQWTVGLGMCGRSFSAFGVRRRASSRGLFAFLRDEHMRVLRPCWAFSRVHLGMNVGQIYTRSGTAKNTRQGLARPFPFKVPACSHFLSCSHGPCPLISALSWRQSRTRNESPPARARPGPGPSVSPPTGGCTAIDRPPAPPARPSAPVPDPSRTRPAEKHRENPMES